MKASDLRSDAYTSFLFKSSPGFGKTCSASSFALEGNIWIAYLDKKKPIELINYYRNIIKRPELLSRIEYDVYGASNANELLNKLISLSKDCRYFAVIIDSLTNLTASAVNWSLGFRDSKSKKIRDPIIPDFDEYKVETSLVSQALDLCKSFPCHVIWTAHPLPSIKIEGSGTSIKITKTNPLVTYGSKVAGMVPGNFNEIYHFSRRSNWDSELGKSSIKYTVSAEGEGDEMAKSALGITGELDITNRLFYEVWKEKLKELTPEVNNGEVKSTEELNPLNPQVSTTSNWPF